MDEELVAGYAGQSIGRLGYRNYRGGYGYGLYFTHDRLIGISYKSLVAHAYRPGYLLELIGFVLLVLLVAYFGITRPAGDSPVPVWLGLLVITMLSAWIVSLYFQLRRSPRQAAKQIHRLAPTSLIGLSNLQPDVSLDRNDISQVLIDFLRISILMKNGEWYLFGVQDPQKDSVRTGVVTSFGQFCSQSPPVTMFVRNRNKQWDLISRAEDLA